jgi:hypothetical protein
VKSPRPPAAVAGFPPDNFGQDFPRITALGDDVTVISMRAKILILRRQGFADGDSGALLADVNVKVATDQPLVFVIETDDVLLGAPDHQHLAQDAELLFS